MRCCLRRCEEDLVLLSCNSVDNSGEEGQFEKITSKPTGLAMEEVKALMERRREEQLNNNMIDNDGRQQEETSKFILSDMSFVLSEYLTPVTCYAGFIYLCGLLFTVFGLVLKFLHLHILRKRYRRIYS